MFLSYFCSFLPNSVVCCLSNFCSDLPPNCMPYRRTTSFCRRVLSPCLLEKGHREHRESSMSQPLVPLSLAMTCLCLASSACVSGSFEKQGVQDHRPPDLAKDIVACAHLLSWFVIILPTENCTFFHAFSTQILAQSNK